MGKNIDELLGAIREGAADTADKASEAASEVAEKIDSALEDATDQGRKIGRQVRQDLLKRWKQVDKVGRENAFIMATGALALGVLIGYLLGRDRD